MTRMSVCPMFPLSSETTMLLKLLLETFKIIIIEHNWTVNQKKTVHRTPVTIGQTEGNYLLVSDGLNMGDRIVTEGYQKLSEGTTVIY